MGKAKASNRFTSAGGRGSSGGSLRENPFYSSSPPKRDRFALSELEKDINSLDENKRSNACALLSDLCRFNGDNAKSMERIASSKILSLLAMRLVDHSMFVKIAATKALKALTEVSDDNTLNRVVSAGVLRTITSLSVQLLQEPSLYSNPSATELLQNMLYVISNIVSTVPRAVTDITDQSPEIISHIFRLFIDPAVPLTLLNTLSNVIIVLTQCSDNLTLISTLIGPPGVQAIHEVLDRLLAQLSLIRKDAMSLQQNECDLWLLVLQCVEMLTNLFLNKSLSRPMQQAIDVPRLLKLALQVFLESTKGDPEEEARAIQPSGMEVDDHAHDLDLDHDLMAIEDASSQGSGASPTESALEHAKPKHSQPNNNNNPSGGAEGPNMMQEELLQAACDLLISIASECNRCIEEAEEMEEEEKEKELEKDGKERGNKTNENLGGVSMDPHEELLLRVNAMLTAIEQLNPVNSILFAALVHTRIKFEKLLSTSALRTIEESSMVGLEAGTGDTLTALTPAHQTTATATAASSTILLSHEGE